jgi:hypothetical protein
MSPLDDVLSVEDDFTFEDITLDPSLAISIATPNTGKKGKNAKPLASVATPGHRGRAWKEGDSILLVNAYV